MEDAEALKRAQRFIRTGHAGSLSDSELALWCDRAIQATTRRSIKAGLSQARLFLRHAKSRGVETRLAGWRVMARLSHMNGAYREALVAYTTARRLAANDPMIRSRIDRALVDVYMYLGQTVKARQSAQSSMRTFRRLGAESDLAQTRVNFANLLHRQDRHREAERLYHQSADFFEKTSNHAATARCYYNRANTLVQLFELNAAEEVYQKAREIWEREGFELDACDVRYGQAWLKMLRGDLHVALIELTACESQYRAAGNPKGEALCSLDRAEAYLNLGMYPEALEAARLSQSLFSRLTLGYEMAKASIFRAQAAHALGNIPEARSALRKAKFGFTQEKNAGFLGVVALLEAELAGPSSRPGRHLQAVARRCFAKSQLPFWQAVGGLKQLQWSSQLSSSLLRDLRHNRAIHEVPQLYAFWQTSLGDRAFETGDDQEAAACWRRAADRLDVVRAQLPPVELRSSFTRGKATPHVRLVSHYLGSDPMEAACWAERFRTAGLWAPIRSSHNPERERVEASLAALSQQISFVVRQSSETRSRGAALSAAGYRQISKLQQQARESLVRLEDPAANNTDFSISNLRERFIEVSNVLPVVQFHTDDQDIVGIVHENGSARTVRFENGVRQLALTMERWRFMLEAELYRQSSESAPDTSTEERFWSELGDWLWSPLEISTSARRVLLIPEGELTNLPFDALRVAGHPLAESHMFLQSPSLRHYLFAKDVAITDASATLFRGPAAELKYVESEIENLREKCGAGLTIVDPCRRHDWPSQGGAGLWHYVGHAELRTDNPFYSFLLLDDGPLFAADFRMKRCSVGLVTLAACRCAEQVALPGEEPTGLVRSLLEMGARSVVAARWPVSDRSTSLWMDTFYNAYFAGASVSRSASVASQKISSYYTSAVHRAAFAVYGADTHWRE